MSRAIVVTSTIVLFEQELFDNGQAVISVLFKLMTSIEGYKSQEDSGFLAFTHLVGFSFLLDVDLLVFWAAVIFCARADKIKNAKRQKHNIRKFLMCSLPFNNLPI